MCQTRSRRKASDRLWTCQGARAGDLRPAVLEAGRLGSIYGEVREGGRCTFGEVFLTDGRIVDNELIVLEDDNGFATTYNPALNVRRGVLREHPKLKDFFNAIAAKLDNDTLRTLNARVDLDKRRPDEVARSFLEANGFTG